MKRSNSRQDQMQMFESTVVATPLAELDRFGRVYDLYLPEIIERIAAEAGLSANKCMSAWVYINPENRIALCDAAVELRIYKPRI